MDSLFSRDAWSESVNNWRCQLLVFQDCYALELTAEQELVFCQTYASVDEAWSAAAHLRSELERDTGAMWTALVPLTFH
jgi:hypothetical protein